MDAFVWKAVVGLIVCTILMCCLILFRSKKSKHKIHYYAAAGGISGPISIAVIAMLMERSGLFFLSIFTLLLICLIVIITSRTVFLEDRAKDLQNLDASAPLCFNDFVSLWHFVVKCERKYGEHKALAIYLLLMAGLAGLSAVIIYYWLMIELIPLRGSGVLFFILPMVVIIVIISYDSFNGEYRTIKKRLKQQQNTSATLGGEQKFCTACGASTAKDAWYCVKCGKKFSE